MLQTLHFILLPVLKTFPTSLLIVSTKKQTTSEIEC
ncbi:MAG: hypothetical protein QG599_2531, partial [Pseudomonadota bacterium]|nr:hypothetical protein [Pseudomonadota bacterium]